MRYLQSLSRPKRVEREPFLLRSVEGKRALHLGCVDTGLLSERLSQKSFLHSRLFSAARELWGLDLDEDGIKSLRALGYSNLHIGSAENPPKAVPRNYFDVVVAGEIIEHVRNVGLLLQSASDLLTSDGLLIITTPNALRFYNSLPAILGKELVHPEHLTWFSPYTLCRAIQASALTVDHMYVYGSVPRARLSGVRNPIVWMMRAAFNCVVAPLHTVLVRLFPYVSDGLIVVSRREQSN